jgi:hypothetical protein
MKSSDYLLYIGLIKCGTALETISAELHTANKIALYNCIGDEEARDFAKKVNKQLRATLIEIEKRNTKLLDDVANIIKESQDE